MSKNNPSKRGKAEQKMYNGKAVRPVRYNGKRVGHGDYMAIQYIEGGEMAYENNDKNGKPLMWAAV